MKAEKLNSLFARARLAVRAVRTQAQQSGVEVVTSADIEQEIKAARRARKQRGRRG